MNENQQASYVFSEAISAMIEAMGMQAENQKRAIEGQSPAYTMKEFTKLQEQYCIGHNSVISFFQKLS